MKNICFALCIALILNKSQALASEAGMPQLNPEFWASQIFWLVLIFSSLYLIMWKIFLPKITYTLENRKSKVVNDLNEAEKLKENAEKKLKEYNVIIENSKKEANKIIEDSRKKLEQDIENKKKKFHNEIEKEIVQAEKEIKELKKTSMLSINSIAAETSFDIIKQVVGIEVNKSSISAIVNDLSKKETDKFI
jgi:F-type H+-transporting ATPase subunit b